MKKDIGKVLDQMIISKVNEDVFMKEIDKTPQIDENTRRAFSTLG